VLVWECQGDGSAGEHDERERGAGGVESVGAAGAQPDLVVQRFGATLGDPEADRGEDPVAVFADRLAEPDERFQAAAGGAAEEPVDQDGDVLEGEVGSEDGAQRFFERVREPYLTAGVAELAVGDRLLVGQALGSLEQYPAGVLEPLCGLLLAGLAQLVLVVAADLVERLVRELYDVVRIDADDRLGCVLAGGLRVPGAHVQRDRLELGGALTDRRLVVLSSGSVRAARAVVAGSRSVPAPDGGSGSSGSSSAKNRSAAALPEPLAPHTTRPR
jgi:hypothetical protein